MSGLLSKVPPQRIIIERHSCTLQLIHHTYPCSDRFLSSSRICQKLENLNILKIGSLHRNSHCLHHSLIGQSLCMCDGRIERVLTVRLLSGPRERPRMYPLAMPPISLFAASLSLCTVFGLGRALGVAILVWLVHRSCSCLTRPAASANQGTVRSLHVKVNEIIAKAGQGKKTIPRIYNDNVGPAAVTHATCSVIKGKKMAQQPPAFPR